MERGQYIHMTNSDNLQANTSKNIIELLSKYDSIPVISLSDFSVGFYQKNIVYNNTSYPMGFFSECALNFVIDNKLKKLQPLLVKLYKGYTSILLNNKKELQLEDVRVLERQFIIINQHLDSLVIFSDIVNTSFMLDQIYDLSLSIHNSDKTIREYLCNLAISYIQIGDALISFYEHIYPFSRNWITNQSEDYNHNYAKAFQDYFSKEIPLQVAVNQNTILPTVMFQHINMQSVFQPIKISDDIVFGETLTFNSYLELLQYDYFKALQNEHTTRVCHNCKKVFLQTTKHHTIYCDKIAPNYADKTCRDIGALNKQKEKVINSPIHQLYKRCYKKLNQRYNRGTITSEAFNDKIIFLNQSKDDALHGVITIEDLNSIIRKL